MLLLLELKASLHCSRLKPRIQPEARCPWRLPKERSPCYSFFLDFTFFPHFTAFVGEFAFFCLPSFLYELLMMSAHPPRNATRHSLEASTVSRLEMSSITIFGTFLNQQFMLGKMRIVHSLLTVLFFPYLMKVFISVLGSHMF